MKISRVIMMLLTVALSSFCILSSTLASYNTQYSGGDAALIAKWNFRVGADAESMHNEGFTFDVFNAQHLSPQDSGENSFLISGGESDVAIEYEIYMNVDVLLADINQIEDGTDYPPLIFYLSSESATVNEPYDDWFSLQDITTDEDGYFLAAEGDIDAGCDGAAAITIHWWWNTSYYVGEPNPDTSETGNYYALALEAYESLLDEYNRQASRAQNFYSQHERIVTMVDGVETVTYHCTAGDSCPITEGAAEGDVDAAHQAVYNDLLGDADDAWEDVNNSLKRQYDAYDTKAVAGLKSLEEGDAQSIVIKVTGSQVAPGR